MHKATCITRLDIVYTVSALNRFPANPSMEYRKAAQIKGFDVFTEKQIFYVSL